MEHFVMECGGLRETTEKCGGDSGAFCDGVRWTVGDYIERCGLGGGISVEEMLLFEGRTEERVERYTKMLEEM